MKTLIKLVLLSTISVALTSYANISRNVDRTKLFKAVIDCNRGTPTPLTACINGNAKRILQQNILRYRGFRNDLTNGRTLSSLSNRNLTEIINKIWNLAIVPRNYSSLDMGVSAKIDTYNRKKAMLVNETFQTCGPLVDRGITDINNNRQLRTCISRAMR